MTQGREQTHSPHEIWIRSIYSLCADILSQAGGGDTQPV